MKNHNEYFTRNCERWALCSKEAASLIASIECDRVSFCQNPNKSLNLNCQDNLGTFSFYSEDPEDEAATWFHRLDLNGVFVVYCYGVGLGYAYDALVGWLRDNPSRSVVFLEDDPQMIHRLFETERGSRLLEDRQVAIHLISADLMMLGSVVVPYCLFSFTLSACQIYEKRRHSRLQEINSLITFFTDYHRATIFDYRDGGVSVFRNYFKNSLKLPDAYNAESLFGQFKGTPAIICGAGPSLDKNIALLAKLQDRALIFAGGTAINALNSKGIVPDIGVGIDPNPAQVSRLITNQGFEMPFLYRNRINPDALDVIHGDKLCVLGSSGFAIGSWFEEKLGITSTASSSNIEEGHNVLNFALSAAHAMGCNPLIVVGVDLAYSQGESYASGIFSHPIHDRASHFKTKSSGEKLIEKKDIYGNPIKTLWKWVRESLWYGMFAENHPHTLVLNCTEGGIGFPGIQNITLQEAAGKYLSGQFDLVTLLHGEIQGSRWKTKVTSCRIVELLNLLSLSLKKCLKSCEGIEKHLEANLKSPSLKKNGARELSEEACEKEALYKEESFRAMLKDIDQAFLNSSLLEKIRLKTDIGQVPDEEIHEKETLIELQRYRFLKRAATDNVKLLDLILSSAKEANLKQVTSENETIHQDESPLFIPDDSIYSFDDHCLNICDAELNLNFSELTPQDAEQRKEEILYPDGTLKAEQNYQGDLLHGPSTFFSQEGITLASSWFIRGLRQGKTRTWYGLGNKHSLQRFFDGRKEGKQEFFYPGGALKSEILYCKGLLDGKTRLYYPDGQLAAELHFSQGKREGKELRWSRKGQLVLEAEFRNDLPIGVANQWHPDGFLACSITYDENSHRIKESYFGADGSPIPDGQLEKRGYFEDLSKYADKLTQSLGSVFSQLSSLMPTATPEQDPNTSQKQPNVKAERSFSKDLKELQDEMAHLQELSHLLSKESNLETKEEDDLTSDDRMQFEQQVLLQHRRLTDQLNSIDRGLKDMLKDPPKKQKPKQKPKQNDRK